MVAWARAMEMGIGVSIVDRFEKHYGGEMNSSS